MNDVNYLLKNKEKILNHQLETTSEMLKRLKEKYFKEFFDKAKTLKLSQVTDEFATKLNDYERSAQIAVNDFSKNTFWFKQVNIRGQAARNKDKTEHVRREYCAVN